MMACFFQSQKENNSNIKHNGKRRHLHKSLTFRRNETLRGQTMEEREIWGI